jgi:ATP-dependent Clp protease protease subunit
LPSAYSDLIFGRMLDERIIVLGATVDDAVASTVVSQLVLLATESPAEEIRLYLNSPGGTLSAGFAVYDAIRSVPTDVSTWAIGRVASVGQFLLSAGTPGKRYALPTARIVMRRPDDEARPPEVRQGWERDMVQLMAECTGQDRTVIERDLDRGRVFSAFEAREYGIVDDVVPGTRNAPANN